MNNPKPYWGHSFTSLITNFLQDKNQNKQNQVNDWVFFVNISVYITTYTNVREILRDIHLQFYNIIQKI